MRFGSVGNTPIAELEFDLLINFFVEHTFMKFMDSGRAGIVVAANDVIDNLETYGLARLNTTLKRKSGDGEFKSVSPSSKLALTIEQRQNLRDYAQRILVDEFIKQGSSGFNSAIRTIYQIVVSNLTTNVSGTKNRSNA